MIETCLLQIYGVKSPISQGILKRERRDRSHIVNMPYHDLLSPKGLCSYLNESSTAEYALGSFDPQRPRKPLWLPSFHGVKKIIEVGKYPLLRELEENESPGIFDRCFGDDQQKVGFVFTERGIICHGNGNPDETYEVIKLRIKKHLNLRGTVLNPLTVRVVARVAGNQDPEFTRTDHVSSGFFWWARADLSD